ncbi:penicillinase repressor BlaI [Paenibacillus sp. MSJ-34]|uniref:penicillinase repressor BlaI n=1 Tax=Paenibacillus sp. MSJ-34 TaxID=2841529 RepID=UPI001C11C678|nr:penicillinase repressor BlaI [Paenibacillus sp. MSJ-34]MBU5445582.1 penicillinase repressor BlaI [Paenibacillus sp. MSJ-34]
MTKDIPKITDAEWEVMEALWESSPRTANEVIESLQHIMDWKPKTIRSLLNRLVQKQAVGINKEGKVYTFYPLYQEDECRRAETHSFVKRIYGGAMKPMIVQFLQEQSLSPEEIKELRKILDEKS